MTERFTTNTVKQTERLCACGTENCRPGQRNGLHCHALAQETFRARQKHRRDAAHRLAIEAIASRTTTEGGK